MNRILGLDVSRGNLTCHLLDRYPSEGLSGYWIKARKSQKELFPVFYASPKPKSAQLSILDFADWVRINRPTLACLEPTGSHYARVWVKVLEVLNVPILWIGHVELKRYRDGKNLPGRGKNDAVDALAIAAYALDPDFCLEDGTPNPRYFLMWQPEKVQIMRDLIQEHEHLSRIQNPILNYYRQLLSWQFPEMAQRKELKKSFFAWVINFSWGINNPEHCSKRAKTCYQKAYNNSVARDLGIVFSDCLIQHSQWLLDIQIEEERIKENLQSLLENPEFSEYLQIFDKFGFGLKTQAVILSRIYPFQNFLLDGKPWIEYEHREVKRPEKQWKDGKTQVKFQAGEIKRLKRNRSRDLFKMRLGLGTHLELSGDSVHTEKPSGSKLCRTHLWLYVLTVIETQQLPTNSEVGKCLSDYCNDLKSAKDSQGNKQLRGKQIQGKLMAKTVNLLYKELVRSLCQ